MNLILAVTGATGSHAARLLMEKSPWPVTLVGSRWGKDVYERECGPFDQLADSAAEVYEDHQLAAKISSGSVETVGMVILPCTTNTMGKIANGLADSLITRAAHCHLKEKRKIVLCVRESPWSLIDLNNAASIASAGGIIMPISLPYYMSTHQDPDKISMDELLRAFVDRVLTLLGHPSETNWETVS